jgi:extracellular factor (EF) 3-hydroxypalmitic acid methyl ester biosynthesis protein
MTAILSLPLERAVGAFVDQVERLRRAELPDDQEAARQALTRTVEAVVGVASAMERAEPLERVREAQLAFRTRVGAVLRQSWIMERAITKPRGYPGDHLLLDAFYTRRVSGTAIGRLLDELVLDCAAGRAVVNRKRYVARWLTERLARRPDAIVADIACGPCRLEREVLDAHVGGRARFIAMDGDDHALAYAREVLGRDPRVALWHENAVRIAREPRAAAPLAGSDYLVSLGLFDYLPDRIAVRLLRALGGALRAGGEMLVGNFAADNPSRVFMEWFGDWPLIHRTEREFLALFQQAGLDGSDLRVEREEPGGSILLVTAVAGGRERHAVSGGARAGAAA